MSPSPVAPEPLGLQKQHSELDISEVLSPALSRCPWQEQLQMVSGELPMELKGVEEKKASSSSDGSGRSPSRLSAAASRSVFLDSLPSRKTWLASPEERSWIPVPHPFLAAFAAGLRPRLLLSDPFSSFLLVGTKASEERASSVSPPSSFSLFLLICFLVFFFSFSLLGVPLVEELPRSLLH